MCRLYFAIIMLAVMVAAISPAAAAGKIKPKCPTAYDTAHAEAVEIQAAYVLAEAPDRKPEACVRAKLYVRALYRVIDAAKSAPKGCPPDMPVIAVQNHVREQTIWRGKIARVCTATTGARQQHRIIHVKPQ